jgi:hypothetical protein
LIFGLWERGWGSGEKKIMVEKKIFLAKYFQLLEVK